MAEYKLLIKACAAKELEAAGANRVRQGSYRIVYLIDDVRHEVTIYKIGHRKDVYR